MSYCGSNILVKPSRTIQEAKGLPCRSWQCADCSGLRKRELIAQALSGNPTSLLTLTVRRSLHKRPDDAAVALAKAWRTLRKRIMRYYGWPVLPFLAVFERHKSGWPHLHILLRAGYIDQRYLSQMMGELLNSPIVDIRHIKSPEQAAWYVAKYLAKDPHKFEGTKRYWQSRDYQLSKTKRDLAKIENSKGWQREPLSLDQWRANWRDVGWTVTDKSPRHAIAVPP